MLDEFIPDDRLPLELVVHDPHALTTFFHSTNQIRGIKKYRLADGKTNVAHASSSSATMGTSNRIAHLFLQIDQEKHEPIGCGHHSIVHRAAIQLPSSTIHPNKHVTVAVKVALDPGEPEDLLRNEGRMYNQLPRKLQGSEGRPPTIPKFYGYYEPCSLAEGSPILLIEECGKDIDIESLTWPQKLHCTSLFAHLHESHFIHGSVYPRNVLVQPGPLSVPRDKRSMVDPSFRIIDFGRTMHIHTTPYDNTEFCTVQWQEIMHINKEILYTGEHRSTTTTATTELYVSGLP